MRLSTDTAFAWIQFLLKAGQVLAAVSAGLMFVVLLISQYNPRGFQSDVVMPMDATLTLATGNEIHINGVLLPAFSNPDIPLWLIKLIVGLVIVLVCGGLYWFLWRLRRFFTVLNEDPFNLSVIRDLQMGARLMLVCQGLTLLFGWVIPLFISKAQARTILQNTLGSLGELEITSGLMFSGSLPIVIDSRWWPLWASLILTILASIFRRAHELREQERALRLDQELTV